MNTRPQQLVLNVILNNKITTYRVQVSFTHGTKPGETLHQKWSFVDTDMTIEEATFVMNKWKEDGYEARIVKITTKTEVIE